MFLTFCKLFDIDINEVSGNKVIAFIEVLAASGLISSTILTYISAIKAKCIEFYINGFSWAHDKDGLMVRSCSCTSTFNPPTKQVLSPLTLTQLITHVATIPHEYICRALFLLAFHGFFRISNLLPTSQSSFQPLRDLARGNVTVSTPGLSVLLKWTKTLQASKDQHLIPLAAIPGSVLCPLQAVMQLNAQYPVPNTAPMFSHMVSNRLVVITKEKARKVLSASLSAMGLDPLNYGLHTFRRIGLNSAHNMNNTSEMVTLSEIALNWVAPLLALADGSETHSCCKYDDYYNCIGYKWNNSQCITINKCDTDNSNKCPVTCFVLKNICVSECPPGSFKEWSKPGYCTLCNQRCLSCFDHGPNHCNSCPQGFYLYQESCVSYCPDNYIPYQGKCVQNCAAVIFNNSCVDTCPPSFYADKIDSNCKACDEECNSCFSNGAGSCKKCRHFSYDNMCVSKCPEDAKYVDNMRCESSCSLYHYSNNTCTDKCPSDDFIQDGKCVDKCPAGSYYTENKKICVTECPHYTVENKCVQTCPRGKYIMRKNCLQTCPPDYQFSNSNFTCLKNCEKLRYEKSCLDNCPSDAMVIYNSTCIAICPSEFPVVDPISHQCVKSCAYFKHNGICTLTCPDNTYADITSKVCLPCMKCLQCTGPLATDCIQCKQYVNGNSIHPCSEECDKGYYSHNNMCYKLCVKSEVGYKYNQDFEYNKENCVVNCPTGQVVSNDSIIVVNKTVGIYLVSASYECVWECSSSHPVAAKVNDLLMCIDTCPDETPYSVTGVCSAYPIPDTFYLMFISMTLIISLLVITGCIDNERRMGRFCLRKDEKQEFDKLYNQYVAGKCN